MRLALTQPVQLLAGIRGVRPADLPREVMAGVTLAALAIPLNIGYAQVAGLPPSAGLYAALVPLVVFALLSSSRQLVAGPDAPIAALIGSLLLALAPANDPKLVQLAFAQALVCALIFFGLWALRLGFLANFLSRAVLIGFISGLGIEVFTSQIPKVLGISVEGEEWLEKVVGIVQGIEDTNVYALFVGVGTFVAIRVLRQVAPQLPGALIALVVMTVIVTVFGWADRGVSVLGTVSEGLPRLGIPQVELSDYVRLFPGALAICGITLADGLLVGRNYAEKRDYQLHANQELFAFGAANVAAGFSGSMTVGSSGSRTAAMDGMGSRSQVPSLVAAGVVAVVLVFFASLLALLPNAALGGIVASAVLSLVEISGLRELYHQRRSEFVVAIVCLLSVLLLGTVAAVVIAFLLSVIDVVRRAATPSTNVLTTVPGIIVYRFGAALFFANAHTFNEDVKQIVGDSQPRPRWFVVDAEAISDIDTTAADALHQTVAWLDAQGVRFGMARLAPGVRALLLRYDLEIPSEMLFASNREAVDAFVRSGQAEQSPGTLEAPARAADPTV